MGSAATIRVEIEAKLVNRVPAALTLKIKQAPELFATGMAEVDRVLGGGIPRGGITEVSGPASTGKTSFGLSAIASITQLGNACAWVDVKRCTVAGVGGGSERRSEAAALAPHVYGAEKRERGQAVVAAGTSVEGNRSAASGRRIRSHRSRYERCIAATHNADSVGDVVSLSTGGGTGSYGPDLSHAIAMRA